MKEQIQNFKTEIEFLREEIRSNREKNSLDKNIDFVNFDLKTPNASCIESQPLNSEIEMLCKANKIDFINNDNIDEGCLSRRKLHLNQKGTSCLAKNLKNYINSC